MRRSQLRLYGGTALSLLSLLFLACGVSYGDGEAGSELFKSLTVEGGSQPLSSLNFVLEYEQPYATGVDVVCDLLELRSEATPKPTATDQPTADPELTPTPPDIPRERPTPLNRVATLIRQSLQENPKGGPLDEVTPVAGSLRHQFLAPEIPGRYAVRCFTPLDDNNSISADFEVAASEG